MRVTDLTHLILPFLIHPIAGADLLCTGRSQCRRRFYHGATRNEPFYFVLCGSHLRFGFGLDARAKWHLTKMLKSLGHFEFCPELKVHNERCFSKPTLHKLSLYHVSILVSLQSMELDFDHNFFRTFLLIYFFIISDHYFEMDRFRYVQTEYR